LASAERAREAEEPGGAVHAHDGAVTNLLLVVMINDRYHHKP
jgi:hypothetical protein